MSAASFDALGTDRDLGSAAYRHEDFPGCESFHLPASEIDHYEGRLEFWDGVTETAWKVCEPTSIQHEQPSRQLAQMAGQLAMLRGSRIVCFGSADLVRRDRADPGHDEAPGAVRRNSGNGRGGGSAGVYERSRLPAANPRAARSGRRASALRRSGADARLVPGSERGCVAVYRAERRERRLTPGEDGFSNRPGRWRCARSCAAAPRSLARATRTACRIRAAPRARRRTPADR